MLFKSHLRAPCAKCQAHSPSNTSRITRRDLCSIAAGISLILPRQFARAGPSLLPQQSSIQGLLASSPSDAVISNPGVSWALSKKDKQLKYPEFLQGIWQVQASFVDAGFPLGKRFINKNVPGITKG